MIWLVALTTQFAAAEDAGTTTIGAAEMSVSNVFADAIRARIIASADASANVFSAITSAVNSVTTAFSAVTSTTDFKKELFHRFNSD